MGDRIIDALTGALTAKLFKGALRDLLAPTWYAPATVAVLFLDVDHLKSILDVYGIPMGDTVLRATAALVRAALPNNGFLFRLGGDEFGAIVPHADRDAAGKIAEQISATVAEQTFATDYATCRSTCSLSIALYPDDLAIYERAYPRRGPVASDDADEQAIRLMQLADNAMHASKNAGGNCIRAAADIEHW